MSVQLTAQVWAIEDVELKDARLLTLLALAEYANTEGVCWPSTSTLAKRTRLCDRQVQRTIQWLTDNDYIEITKKGNGRGNPTNYKITLKGDIADIKGDISTPIESIKGDIADIKGDISTPIESIKGDIADIKGDIGDEIQSHALREPPIEPTTKRRKSNGAAAPVAPKTDDHPAIQAYRDLHKRYPTKAQMIIISERDPPIADWVRAIRAWAARGYKPTNVEGMLEWAFNPKLITERSSRNGANNGTYRGSPATNDEPEYDPEIQRQYDEHVAKRKAEGSTYYR